MTCLHDHLIFAITVSRLLPSYPHYISLVDPAYTHDYIPLLPSFVLFLHLKTVNRLNPLVMLHESIIFLLRSGQDCIDQGVWRVV